MATNAEILEFVKQRDKALRDLDLDYGRRMLPTASSDQVILLAMHKARYECTNIEPELRQLSREWLTARGYGRIHQMPWPEDGELP